MRSTILITHEWPDYKKFIDGTTKSLRNQYDETSARYEIFTFDLAIMYRTHIYKAGFEPVSWTGQQISDNATYRTDFLNNFAPDSNQKMSTELTATEKSNLEMEMAFIARQPSNFTKLTYTGAQLTMVEIFEDETMVVKLLQKDLTYNGNQLVSMTITRIADSATLTKTLDYTGSTLDTIERS